MIYFVRFYFNVHNFVHPNPKAADNPKTLIKVNIPLNFKHILVYTDKFLDNNSRPFVHENFICFMTP